MSCPPFGDRPRLISQAAGYTSIYLADASEVSITSFRSTNKEHPGTQYSRLRNTYRIGQVAFAALGKLTMSQQMICMSPILVDCTTIT